MNYTGAPVATVATPADYEQARQQFAQFHAAEGAQIRQALKLASPTLARGPVVATLKGVAWGAGIGGALGLLFGAPLKGATWGAVLNGLGHLASYEVLRSMSASYGVSGDAHVAGRHHARGYMAGVKAQKPGPPPPPAPGECPYDMMWDPVLQTCTPILPWPIQQ